MLSRHRNAKAENDFQRGILVSIDLRTCSFGFGPLELAPRS
jgi:hypothetical protein